ncbi:MAG: GTP-binding protein [Alphaproteobacteria bacterium]|nr:ADP-ribosylation factor-like protein [Alphaproteobacteria bacterium]TAD87343.1 MAG: GTP-binding protein [Alphaproteobacteria bacterium]
MAARKIVMLGSFAVGKTSLVRRYVLGQFDGRYKATLGVNIYKFRDDGADDPIDLVLWDIEGGESKAPLLKTYVQGASGAVIVGDATRPDTHGLMTDHLLLFQSLLPGRPAVAAMNKGDLAEGRALNLAATPIAVAMGEPPRLTSALSGTAVPDLFRDLSRRILAAGL